MATVKVSAGSNAAMEQVHQKRRWLADHEKDRSNSLIVCWLLGIVLAAKAALAVIAVSTGDFSITLLTTPIFFAMWVKQLAKWRTAREKIARLSSEVPGHQPPDNSQLIKLCLVSAAALIVVVAASLLLRPAG